MRPLRICFLWHFHQPDYRLGEEFSLPWVYMHAVKDYADLIRQFRAFPLKHTVNIVPSLLLQIDEYLRGRRDPVVDLCSRDPESFTASDRQELCRWCRTAQRETMVRPLVRFNELFDRLDDPDSFSAQEILDLQVGLLLSWTGPITRRDERIRSFETMQRFSVADRDLLIALHKEVIRSIVPLLVETERSGQIEISVTPFHHPILPLLCSTNAASESMPHAQLPNPPFQAPEDALWHVREALNDWNHRSGRRPRGMWPAEGSVSNDALKLLRSEGVSWTATDETVLKNSLGSVYTRASPFLQYDVGGEHTSLTMLFRDHDLSDAVGFEYSTWEPHAAATDFVRRLEERRRMIVLELGEDALEYATVPVILDGENCWEFYANNGEPFLHALFTQLSNRTRFDVVTCSEAASQFADRHHQLENIVAGSWIGGNFDIWIGSPEKNAAWTVLREAREAVRRAGDTHELLELIHTLEASDWFWWYDERHVAPNKSDFDRVFRTHLRGIFVQTNEQCSLDLTVPLSEAIMQTAPTLQTVPVSFSKQSSMHEANAITQKLSVQTDGNWQRIIVHFQRPLLETEEINITISDRHHGERQCAVTHDDFMFRSLLHDEGFERLPEGVAIYLHTTTHWFVTIEEQRSKGSSVSTTIPIEVVR